MKKVYLAGPITGLSFGDTEDWRDRVKQFAAANSDKFGHIEFFSPLRGKDYLKNETSIKDTYDEFQFSTSRAIMLRDSFDVRTCDAVLVNFMGATRVSMGTVMELAWAYENRKPVIAITEESGNIHEHAMVNEAIWYKLQNIEDAMRALSMVLNP